MSSDDIYRFRSFGPAPPRKPLQGRFRKSRSSEEMVELAREVAKVLRQTLAPSPAEDLRTSPQRLGMFLIDDKNVLLGEWIDQMVNEGKAAVGMLRAGKKPEEVREKQPRFFTEVVGLISRKREG